MTIDRVVLRSTIPFFREISSDVLDRILPYLYEKTLKKNTTIFLEGEKGDEIYFLRSGAVNIYSFDGMKKVILAVLRKGDYFGEMALIKPGRVRSASAETIALTKLYVLRKADFEELIERYPRIAVSLLNDTMERLRRANQQIYDLTFLNAKTRIAKRLLRLAAEHGAKEAEGLRIEARLTHQQIADMVGAARETVTKVLLELQDGHYIRISNKMILLPDPERLERKLREEW